MHTEQTDWAATGVVETQERLGSPADGLSDAEAAARAERYGPNTLPEHRRSLWGMLRGQLRDVLVYLLLAALLLSLVTPLLEEGPLELSAFLDAAVIGVILVLNTALGLFQEARSESAVSALRALSAPKVRVRRAGRQRVLPAAALVPGDRVLLDTGDRISADGRLVHIAHLQVDESTLTGESLPVHKNTDPLQPGLPEAEQSCMVFAGTLVTAGSGEMLVTATGANTQTGRIAHLVATVRTGDTPLDAQLSRLSLAIASVALAAVAVVAVVGVWRGLPPLEMAQVGIALAVSAVPEGLAAVVTVAFALGAQQMASHNALVRRLDSLATLGAVTVIATDKTGTLTTNRMTVVEHHVAPGEDVALLARVVASCSHARLPDLGDPTEVALVAWGAALGGDRLPIDEEVAPFSSETRYMETRHGALQYLKGAPSALYALAGPHPGLRAAADAMAVRGRRVLAAAVRDAGTVRMIGLVGLEDPPRDGVAEAVALAWRAGIRTVMITGDHRSTAQAIARRVGIDGTAIEGHTLNGLDPAALRERVATCAVFARVSPAHKVAITGALQASGHVVAVTGDGVNDAPALRAAHVGIAMGGRGTEVAREAADIVLADDHFATIVAAIREGRRIHDNIRRFTLFLLRANMDELLLVLLALVLGMPLPYLPIHILWMNLLTDGLPALALAAEEAEPDVMERPPRDPNASLLEGEWGRLAAVVVLCTGSIGAFYAWTLTTAETLALARTETLTLALVLELLLALSARTHLPLWRIDPLSNRWMVAAVATALALHLLLLYTPAGAPFRFEPVSLVSWGRILAVAGLTFLAYEALKAVGSRSATPACGPSHRLDVPSE